MPHGIETGLIETVTPMVRELVTTHARALADLHYADVRLEISEGKFAGAENGEAKTSGDDYAFALGIRVLAGRRMTAPGYFGRGLGAADVPHLARLLREGLMAAYRRAMANAEMKAEVKGKFGSLGDALTDTRLHPIAVRQEVVPAVFEVDPRGVALDDMQRLTTDVSRRVAGFHASASYNYISTMTQLSRELFASSEGAVIDQSFALTQGMCYVVATGADNSQEIYDVLGHQRGWEILTRGVAEPLIEFPPFPEFALALAARRGGAGRRARARGSRRGGAGRHRPALQHPALPRDRGPPGGARPRAQDGDRVRGALLAAARPRRHPARQAHRLAAGERVLRPVPARLRPLRLRSRGHAGAPGRPHRPRACSPAS